MDAFICFIYKALSKRGGKLFCQQGRRVCTLDECSHYYARSHERAYKHGNGRSRNVVVVSELQDLLLDGQLNVGLFLLKILAILF